jgi:two-component system, NarL family, response regulator LiaR
MGRTLVRVAVLSESTIVREGLASMIGGLGNRAIVVDADLSHGRPPHVDVVVYDLGATPGLNGYAELRRLVRLDIPMVALVYDGVAGVGRLANGVRPDCGAQLISLDVTAAELLQVLERVAPDCAGDRLGPNGRRPPAGLTNRELTVIALIGSGLSNKQIADRLFVSGNTVKTYIRTAYRKIGVQSRIHAAMWAMEHGLVARPVRENPKNEVLVPSPSHGDRN